jgi:hypothetical protein
MRALTLTLILAATIGLGACNRRDSTHRDEPAARKAGRAAYNLEQELKRDARVAAEKLRRAGKEAREGWNEAKHDDPKYDHPKYDDRADRKK